MRLPIPKNQKQNEVALDWCTATEIINDYFTVERSAEAEIWGEILTKKGAGNSSVTFSHVFSLNEAKKWVLFLHNGIFQAVSGMPPGKLLNMNEYTGAMLHCSRSYSAFCQAAPQAPPEKYRYVKIKPICVCLVEAKNV